MAARPILPEEFAKAVELYCVESGVEASEGEDNGRKRYLLSPGDIIVRLEEGRIITESQSTYEKLCEILMDLRRAEPTSAPKPAVSPRSKAIVPSGKRTPGIGSLAGLTVEDVKAHFCPLATDQEAYTFLQICLAAKANPWLGEAYLIKYDEKSPAKTVMGKYHFLKKAEAHPQYGGFASGIIVLNAQGAVEERIGKFKLPDEKLLGGWAEVVRKDRTVPKRVTVTLSEYAKDNKQWRTMPSTMIEKIAIVQAHRDMFPGDMGGLYDAAEIIEAECEVA